MKNRIWIVIVLIFAALFVLESRYSLVINSPIVAKIDRLTGDVWIANSGMWLKVQHHAASKVWCDSQAGGAKPSGKITEKTTK